MKKFIKYFLILISAIIVIVLVCLTAIYLKYRSIEKQNLPAQYEKTVVIPNDEVFLGTPVKVELYFSAPWNRTPLSVVVTPGKGSQLIGKPIIIKNSNKWGYSVWLIKYKVQPFVDGLIPEGSLKVDFLSENYDSQALTVKYPSIRSKKISVSDNQLSVASKMESEALIVGSNVFFYSILIALILLFLSIVIALFLRRKNKKNMVVLTPWDLAIQSLDSLNKSFGLHEITSGKCINILSDIVREYLESRFDIHAKRQTTAEFLRKMEEFKSPLGNQDRNFLKDFMTSTDMVKFAKYEASEELIRDSIDRASKLVNETTLDESENDVNN